MYFKSICFAIFVLVIFQNKSYAQPYSFVQNLIPNDLEEAENNGFSIAVDGDYLLTGAWWKDLPGMNTAGAAYLYKKDQDGSWLELTRLFSPSPEALGYFGHSVAIHGNVFVIGTTNEDDMVAGTGNSGAAYVYEILPGDQIEMVGQINHPDPANADNFGHDVSIYGNFIIAGTPNQDTDANAMNEMQQAGAAYVFERQGDGSWAYLQKLVAPDRAGGDHFGRRVDIRDNQIIITAENHSPGGDTPAFAGACYIFELDPNSNLWNPKQMIFDEQTNHASTFGCDAAIDGDWLIVGACNDNAVPEGGTQNGTGAVHFFKRGESGSWEHYQKLFSSDHGTGDSFGNFVDLDGRVAVVGAPFEDEDADGNNPLANSGSAYIFERESDEEWSEVQKIVGENRAVDDLFGSAVSVRGPQISTGAWRADVPVNDELLIDAGATYVFERDEILDILHFENDLQLKVFPNPSFGELIVSGTMSPSGVITIYNSFGQLQFQQELLTDSFIQKDDWIFNTNLNHLTPGTYFIQIQLATGETGTMKWVKK